MYVRGTVHTSLNLSMLSAPGYAVGNGNSQ